MIYIKDTKQIMKNLSILELNRIKQNKKVIKLKKDIINK